MRVLFHYTHRQTLGHTTRSVSVVNALIHHGARVHLLQGGLPQPFVCFPKKCPVSDIPAPFDTKESFHSNPKIRPTKLRADFILKTALDFKPDVFITEFFPFGRLDYASELLPTLNYLRKKNVQIMASIGYPAIVSLERFAEKRFAVTRKALFAFFDEFLIHTPPGLETPYIERTIHPAALTSVYKTALRDLRPKIVYTGYIPPDKIIHGGAQLPSLHAPDTILVSRGGGAVCPNIITSAIEAKRYLDVKHNMIIVCGPAASAAEIEKYTADLRPRDKNHVCLVGYLDDLNDLFRTCAVSVNQCGYNTAVQLLRYGTPSIIIPYSTETAINDQLARANLLKMKISSSVLTYTKLTGPVLAKAIKHKLNMPRPSPAPAEWFNGAEVSAKKILNKA